MIPFKWVFRVKKSPTGFGEKIKSRITAKGFDQVLRFDFQEILNPIVKPITIRIIITITLLRSGSCINWILIMFFKMEVFKKFIWLNNLLDLKILHILIRCVNLIEISMILNKHILIRCVLWDLLDPRLIFLFLYFQFATCIYLLVYAYDIIIGGDEIVISFLTMHFNVMFSLKYLGFNYSLIWKWLLLLMVNCCCFILNILNSFYITFIRNCLSLLGLLWWLFLLSTYDSQPLSDPHL